MSNLRAEIWCSAFVRRQNNLGNICVLSRRGDPVAGQVWVEIDHLDGTATLLAPAPSLSVDANNIDWPFARRFDRASAKDVAARIAQESRFDPDFWLITVESRTTDLGLNIVELD